MIESVHRFAVSRHAAGSREGLAAGGARVRVVAGMGAYVCRQVARLGESHPGHYRRPVQGPRGVLGEWAFSYGRGTPVGF